LRMKIPAVYECDRAQQGEESPHTARVKNAMTIFLDYTSVYHTRAASA